MLNLFALVYLGLLTDYAKGVEVPADRISGGILSEKGEFPYFAQLSIGTQKINGTIMTTECGGTLIEPSWILTAAHCFRKEKYSVPSYMYKNNFVAAYMGSNMIYPFADKVAIRYINRSHIHPNYRYKKIKSDDFFDSDVALARLKSPFILSELIATIHLPKRKTRLCRKGVVIGSGIEKRIAKNRSKHVEYVVVRTRTLDQISLQPRAQRYGIFYSETMWLHGNPVAGDMGGPFVCHRQSKPTQYGIMSDYYSNLRRRTSITQYEPVDRYLNFIRRLVPLHYIYSIKPKKQRKMGPLAPKPILGAGFKRSFYIYLIIVVPVCVLYL